MQSSLELGLSSPVGLVAGNGLLPVEFAKAARSRGLEVLAACHSGETSPELTAVCVDTLWVSVGQISKIIKFFKRSGVRQVAFAGGIRRPALFRGGVRPDLRALKVLSKVRSFRDDALLRAVSREFESSGLKVISATDVLKDICPGPGPLTKRELSPGEASDAALGWNLAKQLGSLDVGQAVCIKAGQVLAVEALEGTDAMIRRAGELGAGAGVLVKTCKPQQDLRLDLPAVGPSTIQTLIESGGSALVIEARKTIMLEAGKTIELANKHGIAISVHSSFEQSREKAKVQRQD